MAPRSGYRRVDHGSPLVDLDVVFADDLLVDGIADCRRAHTDRPGPDRSTQDRSTQDRLKQRSVGPAGDPVMDLFRSWRDELTSVPLPPPPDVRHALAGVPTEDAAGRRSLRPALAIAAAIAALLVGTATVGSRHAAPDSALWAVTQVIWPDRAESVASRQHVEDALHEAEAALANGQTQQAQLALLRAAMELGKVDDVDGRGDMQVQVDQLWRAAAPQELSSGSPLPYLLADGPETAAASPMSSSSAVGQARGGRPGSSPTGLAATAAPTNAAQTNAAAINTASTNAAPTTTAPINAAPINAAPIDAAPINAAPIDAAPIDAAPTNDVAPAQPGPARSSTAPSGPLTPAGSDPADPAPRSPDPVPATAGNEVAPPPAAPVVSGGPVTAPPVVAAPPVQTPPVQPSSPAEQPPLVTAPTSAPVAAPPPTADPGTVPATAPVPSTAPALTPPPPNAAVPTVSPPPEPVVSAAPPAPAPAPVPTGTEPGVDHTDAGTSGNGSADANSSAQQAFVDGATPADRDADTPGGSTG